MSRRPACAGTQTGTPQRLKTPPIPQLWGEQHTPRIRSRRAPGAQSSVLHDEAPAEGGIGEAARFSGLRLDYPCPGLKAAGHG